MTNEELGVKCKEAMLEHLVSVNYDNMTREQIVKELKPMRLKLESLGLTEELNKRNFTFRMLCEIAANKAQEAAKMFHYSGFARANPGRV